MGLSILNQANFSVRGFLEWYCSSLVSCLMMLGIYFVSFCAMLPVSIDWPFLVVPSIFSNVFDAIKIHCNILFYISGGLELFKGLLKSEFSEENVEFWITCEEFRCSGDANMQVFAQKIYGDFVIFNGPKEVWNLFNWLYSIVIRIMYCNMIVSRMNSKFHYVFK